MITISISDDHMIAFVSGFLDDILNEHDAAQMLMKALLDAGVVHGIREDVVGLIALRLGNGIRIDHEAVAAGTMPGSAILKTVKYSTHIYSEKELPLERCTGYPLSLHYAWLPPLGNTKAYLREGDMCGTAIMDRSSVTGCSVLGGAVALTTPQEQERLISPGRGQRIRPQTNEVIADSAGVLIGKDGKTALLPVRVDAEVQVIISADRLTATMSVLPPGPNGRVLSPITIREALTKAGLAFLVSPDLLAHACKIGSVSGGVQEFSLGAGTAAVDGIDGKLEYLVNLSFSHEPQMRLDGTADYYAIHIFENVLAGQPIARLIPPTAGTSGLDVFGKVISPVAGKPVAEIRGQNVDIDSSMPQLWIAGCTGHVYLRNNTVVIEETLVITGDVDFNTGNVDFVGDVIISGDVRSGFSVKADGSVRVRGAVEDATIEATRNVIVHAGFMGKGEGRIKAGHDVVVRHVLNQTIVAKNTIMVSSEAIEAQLFAGNLVLVEGRRSMIAGGRVIARNAIRARTIGNTANSTTHIYAGLDLFVKNALAELEKEVQELDLARESAHGAHLHTHSDSTAFETAASHRKSSQLTFDQINELYLRKKERLQTLRQGYHRQSVDSSGLVFVYETIFAGTTIQVGDRKQVLVYDMNHCLFSVQGDEIVSRPLTNALVG